MHARDRLALRNGRSARGFPGHHAPTRAAVTSPSRIEVHIIAGGLRKAVVMRRPPRDPFWSPRIAVTTGNPGGRNSGWRGWEAGMPPRAGICQDSHDPPAHVRPASAARQWARDCCPGRSTGRSPGREPRDMCSRVVSSWRGMVPARDSRALRRVRRVRQATASLLTP